MKALAWTLTAAAIAIGADVFVLSSDRVAQPAHATSIERPMALAGGVTGYPPPPNAY